jgi:hypothetical protein
MADNHDFSRKRKFEEMEHSNAFNEDSEMHDMNYSNPKPTATAQYGRRFHDNDPMDVDDEKFHEDSDNDIIAHDESENASDNVSGDDLMENMEDDYRPIDKLDRYENIGIDDNSENNHKGLTLAERQKVDKLLATTNPLHNPLKKRLPVAMLSQGDEFSEDDELARQLRRERQRLIVEHDGNEEEEDEGKYLDLEEAKGNISEWLKQPRTVKFIRHQFGSFLRNFKDDKDVDVYEARISEM